MRSILLAGLLGMLMGLGPRPSSADGVSEIFVDFPELAEWGRPVFIGGYEFWQPHPAYLAAGWEPYTNGYLYEDPNDGLTWVSQDPWGFITEHYGYWRHHESYGFVWRPLYPLEWRPYVASIFRDRGGRIVGWCPFYYDVWSHGHYVIGFGFNDYYWGAFWGRVHYADFYSYHWWRFRGYYTAVTIYDYRRYYRPFPGPCHRRDREYRHRRERQGDRKRSDLAVRSEIPARHAEATPVRRRTGAQAPSPQRQVGVPTRGLRVSPQGARPAREVTAPARQSNLAREREERMQVLRERMQSNALSSVTQRRGSQPRAAAGVGARPSPSRTPARVTEPQRPARSRPSDSVVAPRRMAPSRTPARVTEPQRPARSRPSASVVAPRRTERPSVPLQRGRLEVRRPSSPAATVSRPPLRAPRPAASRVAPRQAAPSRPAVKAPSRRSSGADRARQALPVKGRSKGKRGS